MSVADSKAVFLSYASQDADAARRICDALRAAGVEVWFDQSELRGGDAWDAKIRKQIAACALFVPVISAATQARREGYFRLEWRLAAQRTHMMSEQVAFLLPIVIDATRDADADVPAEFKAVQWTRLPLRQAQGSEQPGGETPAAFCVRVKNLLGGSSGTGVPPVSEELNHGRNARAKTELRQPGRRWLLPAMIGIVGCAVVAIWQPWKKSAAPVSSTAGTPPTAGAVGADDKAVAVLPFANVSGDREQEYFSDGLTEEILNALARERDLRVPGRASAFSFKNTKTVPAEIARALNVTRLVEGSVRRIGNHVRIAVQLTRAADGFSESLGSFDKELTDGAAIFALQEEVARVVVEKLTRRTTMATVAVTTTNSAAYDAYLRGRSYLVQTTPFWPKAAEEFRRAVELDPKFALAWGSLGRVLATLYGYGFDGGALGPTQHALDQALQLDPELPEAHLARAVLLQEMHAPLDEVRRALDRAEQRRPNDSDVIAQRASFEAARGRGDLGLTLLQRAVELDPRNGGKLNALGNALADEGRYAEAEATYREAFQVLGSSVPVTNRARVYFHWKGDRALVLRTLDEVPEEMRGDRYWYSRGTLLYAIGDFPRALAALAKTRERAEFFRIRAYYTGRVREAMGDAAGAQRDYLAALPVAEKQCADFPELPAPYTTLALVYTGLGRQQDALAAARKSLELVRPAEYLREASGSRNVHLGGLYALAFVQARFGLNDEALAIVEQETRAGRWRRNELLLHTDWAELRRDARFKAIAEKARP